MHSRHNLQPISNDPVLMFFVECLLRKEVAYDRNPKLGGGFGSHQSVFIIIDGHGP